MLLNYPKRIQKARRSSGEWNCLVVDDCPNQQLAWLCLANVIYFLCAPGKPHRSGKAPAAQLTALLPPTLASCHSLVAEMQTWATWLCHALPIERVRYGMLQCRASTHVLNQTYHFALQDLTSHNAFPEPHPCRTICVRVLHSTTQYYIVLHSTTQYYCICLEAQDAMGPSGSSLPATPDIGAQLVGTSSVHGIP